jgi:hypothetical protein
MRKFSLVAVTIGVLFALPAAAQVPPAPAAPDAQTRIRGTIEKFDGESLTVQSREGPQVTIGLAPNFTVVGVAKRSLGGDASLLKPGAAIFCIAQKKADGSLTAARITAEKDGVKPPM